jgi:photosystem II stability/assembly factor-like uncharacterized protein
MEHVAMKYGLRAVVWCLAAALAGCAGTRETALTWQDSGGPAACDVSAMLADDAQPGTVYAGLTTGAVYLSTDRGQTWTLAGSLPKGGSVNALVQDPENAARLFAATSSGAFLSKDRGATWKDLQVGGTAGIPVLSLSIDPWKPSVLIAGTRGRGMFRSTDGGASWSPVVSPTDATLSFADVYDIDIDLQKPDVLYAAISGAGVARSTDAGISWTRLTPEASPTASAITHVLVRRTAGNEILYGTAAGAIFRSTDRGTNWTQVRHGLEVDRILSLESAHKGPETVYAGTMTGVIRSTDFGTTWSSVGEKLPRVPVSVALPNTESDPTVFLYGEGLGVVASSDSMNSWSPAQSGLGGSTVSQILSDSTGDRVYASTGSTVLRRDRASGSWVPAGSGLTGGRIESFAFDADSAGGMYAATPAGVYRTSDAGDSWRAVPRRLSVAPIFLDTHPTIGTRILASGEQGLFVSTDRGNSWGQVRPLGNRFSVRSLTFAPTNAGIIFGAGTTGVIGTADGGMNWTPTRFGLGGDETIAITFGTTDGQICYAWTTRGEGFKSVNRGLEWAAIKTPWASGGRMLLAFDRYKPSDAVAVIDGKELYHTANGGETWSPVKGIDIPFEITALHWNAKTSTLTAGARGTGVKILPLGRVLASPASPGASPR